MYWTCAFETSCLFRVFAFELCVGVGAQWREFYLIVTRAGEIQLLQLLPLRPGCTIASATLCANGLLHQLDKGPDFWICNFVEVFFSCNDIFERACAPHKSAATERRSIILHDTETEPFTETEP